MDLTPYVASLGRELLTAVESGDDVAGPVVERLTASMESAIRLTLLEAISAAADETPRDLAPGSAQVTLRGRAPQLVVPPPPTDEPAASTPPAPTAPVEDALAGLED